MDEEQDLNPTPEPDIPNQDVLPDTLPAEDFETPLPLAQGEEDTTDLLQQVDTIGEQLSKAGEEEEPPPAPVSLPDDTPEPTDIPPDSTLTGEDLAAGEDVPPELRDLDEASKSLESFGDRLNAFNDAGGADNSLPNMGQEDDGGGDRDGAQQLMDSDFDNRNQMKDMLIEHARRLDEITRYLEAERL